jgi:hypothetical protein
VGVPRYYVQPVSPAAQGGSLSSSRVLLRQSARVRLAPANGSNVFYEVW